MEAPSLDDARSQADDSARSTPDSTTFDRDNQMRPSGLAEPDAVATFDQRLTYHRQADETKNDYEDWYAASRSEHDNLLKIIKKYSQKAKKPSLDMTVTHDWTGVEESVKAACDRMGSLFAEDQITPGLRGKLKKGFRTLCEYAGTGQTFVSLIPDDVFGLSSLLCGALKLIFSAMQQSEAHRTEVYKSLAELPVIICDHSVPWKGENSDQLLHRRASELYASIFRFLAHIFEWFSNNPVLAGMKFIVNPGRLRESLKESFDEVKDKAQDFRNRVMIRSLELQIESMQLQRSSRYNQDIMLGDMKNILALMSSIQQKLERVTLLGLFDPNLQDNIATKIADKVESQFMHRQKRDELPEQLARDFLVKFFKDFNYDPCLVARDCESFISRLELIGFGEADQEYLTAVHHNDRIREFLTADTSSLLAVIGNCDPQPDSSISLLTAKIVQRLFDISSGRNHGDQIIRIIPLAFFCGEHRSRRDPYANPTGLALSLLLQLIDRHYDYMTLECLDRCRSYIKSADMRNICKTLAELINSLGDKVILVVVIEGLEFFAQTKGMRDATRHLLHTLVSTYRSGAEAMMKILFTSPSRLDFVEDILEDEEILGFLPGMHNAGQYPEWVAFEPLQIGFGQ